MKFNNIEKLQHFILQSMENLEKKKIDVIEMGIIAKSSESIMSSLKLQLAYNNMRDEVPNIKFLEDCNEGERKSTQLKAIK